MNNRIFTLGLSVEAISLYLILYDLDSFRIPLEKENIQPRWHASQEQLDQALEELVMHNVVQKKGEVLEVNPEALWAESRSS